MAGMFLSSGPTVTDAVLLGLSVAVDKNGPSGDCHVEIEVTVNSVDRTKTDDEHGDKSVVDITVSVRLIDDEGGAERMSAMVRSSVVVISDPHVTSFERDVLACAIGTVYASTRTRLFSLTSETPMRGFLMPEADPGLIADSLLKRQEEVKD